MDPIETQPQHPGKKNVYLFILAALIVVAVVEFVLLMSKGKAPSAVSTVGDKTAVTPAQEQTISEGFFKIAAGDTAAGYVVGVPFTVTLNVDSNGRRVVGFDAVVEYDESAFTLGQVTSNEDGFTAISSTRKKYLEKTS